jgi:retron-type reverse transcriptase
MDAKPLCDPSIFPLVSIRKLESILGCERAELISCAERAGSYYKPFAQRKIKGKGKWRLIDNPKDPLKQIQTKIKKCLFSKLTFPETLIGGVKGKSTHDNARIHKKQPVVITIDLKDCFPRTRDKVVFSRLREVLGCSPHIAGILTKLTTFQHRVPQGAPTSNAVVNLALLPLHDEIKEIAESLNLRFSIYVDDITISGENAEVVIDEVVKAIQRHGYAVRNKKIKVMPRSSPQEVVGFVVNRKVSIANSKIEAVRKAVVDIGKANVLPNYLLKSIEGRINHVRSVKPAKAEALKALLDKVKPKKTIKMAKPNLKESFEVKSGSEFLRKTKLK